MQQSYVQQSLSPGEKVVFIGQFHWIYTLHAVLNIVWGILGCIAVIVIATAYEVYYGAGQQGMGWLDAVRSLHPIIRLGAFFIFIMGLLKFAEMMCVRASTEVAVTSSRIIYKRGMVARYVGEISTDRIEGVNVVQTVPGRIFGYGRILIHGMGVGEMLLPPLANPVELRKAIEQARTVV